MGHEHITTTLLAEALSTSEVAGQWHLAAIACPRMRRLLVRVRRWWRVVDVGREGLRVYQVEPTYRESSFNRTLHDSSMQLLKHARRHERRA